MRESTLGRQEPVFRFPQTCNLFTSERLEKLKEAFRIGRFITLAEHLRRGFTIEEQRAFYTELFGTQEEILPNLADFVDFLVRINNIKSTSNHLPPIKVDGQVQNYTSHYFHRPYSAFIVNSPQKANGLVADAVCGKYQQVNEEFIRDIIGSFRTSDRCQGDKNSKNVISDAVHAAVETLPNLEVGHPPIIAAILRIGALYIITQDRLSPEQRALGNPAEDLIKLLEKGIIPVAVVEKGLLKIQTKLAVYLPKPKFPNESTPSPTASAQ